MRRSDLEYQASLISKLTSFPVRIYEGNELVYSASVIKIAANPVDLYLDEILSIPDRAFCFRTNEGMYFGILHFAKEVFILGPAIASTLTQASIRFLAERLSITDEEQLASITQAYQLIRRTSYWSIVDLLRIIDFSVTGAKLDTSDIVMRNTQQEARETPNQTAVSLSDINSSGRPESTYFTYENLSGLLDIIEHGDVVAFESIASSIPVTEQDIENSVSLRTVKNSFIAAGTLFCQAAIHGGIHPDYSMTLCRNYIEKAELLEEADSVAKLRFEMASDYVRRVNALRRGKRPSKLETDVYNYISVHITEHITTEAIAKSLFLSRGYLSTRFKEETGKSLSDYIREQKLMEAKKLLDHPVYSLAEIGEMLGYSSQGHFSNAFKKLTGITPLEYRQRKPGSKE